MTFAEDYKANKTTPIFFTRGICERTWCQFNNRESMGNRKEQT